MAINSFMAEGGDGYLALKDGREIARHSLISEVLAAHIKSARTITPPPLGRLIPAYPVIARGCGRDMLEAESASR